MSNRGWLVTNPGSRRSAIIAESASYIPLFWPAFLAPADLNAAETGQFRLDGKQAVELAEHRLLFVSSLFPEVRSFRAVAEAIIQKVREKRRVTIGIEITDLLEDEFDPAMPGLETAVDLIDRQQADCSITVPARTITNPFVPGTTIRRDERYFCSTRDLLMTICLVSPDFLRSKSKEDIQETIIGHVRK